LNISDKINKWGVLSIALCAGAFAVPSHIPWCAVYPLLHILALACSIVAAVRGSKVWLVLSGLTALLTFQAVLALITEC